MCGIFAYLGGDSCVKIILDGIEQLKNRGYDSAGISLFYNNNLYVKKYASTPEKNAIDIIRNNVNLDGNNCISHTRWATHGAMTDINSHPHLSNDGKISVVHNGIIENYLDLKLMLENFGINMISDTHTEIIPNLIAYYLEEYKNITQAILKSFSLLEGTWGVVIQYINEPNKLYCIRNGSPLLVSINEKNAFIASEVSAIQNFSKSYFILDSNDLCEIEFKNNKILYKTDKTYKKLITVNKNNNNQLLDKYKHWTIQEIYEQSLSSNRTIKFGARLLNNNEVKLCGLDDNEIILKNIDNIILLGCGTSYFAGLIGINYFKQLCKFNTIQIFDGSEFNENDIPRFGNTILIFLSQSGETKDLHRCIEIGKQNDLFMIGIINVVDSLIAREVNCGLYLHAGREVSVASTKCFTSQIIALNLVAIWFSQIKNINKYKREKYISELRTLPVKFKETIEYIDNKLCKENILDIFDNKHSIFILGKGENEGIAKEGSLKIKEISYYHAEGYNGSALKHGPFSLLEEDFPVILIAPKDEHYKKMCNTYHEIKSRHAKILFITDDDQCDFDNVLLIPKSTCFSSLISIIPLQLIAYYLSIKKGINPDYPRNLAKSVVVE